MAALCLREGADNPSYVRALSEAVRRVVDVDALQEDVRLGCLLSVMHVSVSFTQGNNVRKKNEDFQRNVVVGLQQIVPVVWEHICANMELCGESRPGEECVYLFSDFLRLVDVLGRELSINDKKISSAANGLLDTATWDDAPLLPGVALLPVRC